MTIVCFSGTDDESRMSTDQRNRRLPSHNNELNSVLGQSCKKDSLGIVSLIVADDLVKIRLVVCVFVSRCQFQISRFQRRSNDSSKRHCAGRANSIPADESWAEN